MEVNKTSDSCECLGLPPVNSTALFFGNRRWVGRLLGFYGLVGERECEEIGYGIFKCGLGEVGRVVRI